MNENGKASQGTYTRDLAKYKSKRRFRYIRGKKKNLDNCDLPNTSELITQKKRAFMTLLTNQDVSISSIKAFDFEYYQWLYFWYNPKSKQKISKTFEDIPFYDKKLYNDFKHLYLCIINKQKFLKEDFLELSVQFYFKEKTYDNLFDLTPQIEALEKMNTSGAFYYKLPKKYIYFEMFFKDYKGSYLSNHKINIASKKLNSLSKHLVYFGIIDKSNSKVGKPYFIGYYSKEELKKKSNFSSIERMNFLKFTLKEKGILGHSLEGNFIWDIDDIEPIKTDVLVLISKGSLFNLYESFVLKGS